MENIELGYKLREYRKMKKLTQQEVADLTNVSLKTIQRYEKGLNIPKDFIMDFHYKLHLEPYEGNSLLLLHSGISKNSHDEIKFYIDEIIKEIGYEFIKIGDYDTYNTSGNYLIKNNISDEYYISSESPYRFNYANVVFNFLKSVVEEDVKNSNPISKEEVKLYSSYEYEDLISYYNVKVQSYEIKKLSAIISQTPLPSEKELEDIKKWKEEELQKLRTKLLKSKD
ncbi:XRE family transcriptional regulator [Fusobacterium necrophorum]|uniref:XRE family transcriptional regulator n=1 Tax=Fusobacterium necrophorum TaxID=859 RepID=A0A4Q2L0S3_9FUSO|nr:helix-turn-helix transcriptional regulator [Fusobacterium necrophorum]RXZ69822.1 XRE family transcriptional regulator [Fusobacterium necrophorum]